MPNENADANALPDSDPGGDYVWNKRCDYLYKAWVQVRYHRKRQRFFDLADKLSKTATIILGASLIGEQIREYLPYLAALIALSGSLSLVFGYGDRKQLHKELAEQAANLVAAIEQVSAGELSPSIVARFGVDYARLCVKAPPPLRVLTLICEREQSVADGYPNHIPQPQFFRRIFAQFKE